MQRRQFLRQALTLGGAASLGAPQQVLDAFLRQTCRPQPLGDLIALLPLHGDRGRSTPFGEVVGGPGLDARRFTDLSKLQPDRLITPTAEMFLRTAAPAALKDGVDTWPLPLADLRRRARPMGTHLIECSGNTDPDNFGLLSAAEWNGVPLAEYAATLPPVAGDAGLAVRGVDPDVPSRSSAAGASWIFSSAAVQRTGAFLATHMNGEPLPLAHGAPIRLVVPGWYGCSWIKWVDEIRRIGPDEPVSAQMIEFSLRTHQRSIPARALDYEPPVIDLAATPVRVEKRRIDGRLEYRVVGIVWGGDRAVDRLTIRFRAGEPPVTFPICPAPQTHHTWSLWEYRWRPTSAGIYSIALGAADPAIRTRRLDVSFYVRRVIIDEV